GNAGAGGQGGQGGGAPACSMPIMAADPSMVMGDTTGKSSNGDGFCQNSDNAPDDVYQITAPADGALDIELDSMADLGLYVRTACDDPDSEIDCADDTIGAGHESLKVTVTKGQTYFIFVDGFTNADFGPYSLSMSTHAVVCGDMVVDPGEDCDPPDMIHCDSMCQQIPEMGRCN